jgi:hypothetical protein
MYKLKGYYTRIEHELGYDSLIHWDIDFYDRSLVALSTHVEAILAKYTYQPVGALKTFTDGVITVTPTITNILFEPFVAQSYRGGVDTWRLQLTMETGTPDTIGSYDELFQAVIPQEIREGEYGVSPEAV